MSSPIQRRRDEFRRLVRPHVTTKSEGTGGRETRSRSIAEVSPLDSLVDLFDSELRVQQDRDRGCDRSHLSFFICVIAVHCACTLIYRIIYNHD